MSYIDWINDKKLNEHVEKRFIQVPRNFDRWRNLYNNYYDYRIGTFNDILDEYRNNKKEKLIDFYKNVSIKNVYDSETKYLHQDSWGNISVNFLSRNRRNLTTCTQADISEHECVGNSLKINSCFFKDDIIEHIEIFYLINNIKYDNINNGLKSIKCKIFDKNTFIDEIITMAATDLSVIGIENKDKIIKEFKCKVGKIYFKKVIDSSRNSNLELYKILYNSLNNSDEYSISNNAINSIIKMKENLLKIKDNYDKKDDYELFVYVINIAISYINKNYNRHISKLKQDSKYWNKLFG